MRASDLGRRQSVLRKIDALPLLPQKKQALREAALDLLRDRAVRGVALYGSASRGEPDPGDFDLVVLVSGDRTWTRRRLYHGCSVHLQMRGVTRFRRMNIERKQKRSEQPPPFADLLALWDDTGSFATTRAKCRRLRARGPKPVSRWEAGRLQADVTTFVEDMQALSGDHAAFALIAARALTRCLQVHLRLRGQWTLGEKHLLPAAAGLDEDLAARYRDAVSLLNRPAACLEATRALAAEALAPVGGLVGDFEVWYR
jgi:hypothetical protein